MHSAFGVSWMELLSCVVTARDTMAVLCMAALFGRFTMGRIITVGTRIGIFSRKRGLKRDIFIKTYFNGNIYLLKLLLFGNSFSIRR
jgi:hypothetical protein